MSETQGAWSLTGPRSALTLWDYRRRVAELYGAARALPGAKGWSEWCVGRDRLFATHPQSPIPADRRPVFDGIPYFPYEAALRVVAAVEPASGERVALPHSGDGTTAALAFALARFEVAGRDLALTLYRLDAYGDGVILPFADATSGHTTYGGGRYLIDTVKGADLGSTDDSVTLDFNFAYHPSCVHDPRWSCPLAPPGNRLSVPIEAGERLGDA